MHTPEVLVAKTVTADATARRAIEVRQRYSLNSSERRALMVTLDAALLLVLAWLVAQHVGGPGSAVSLSLVTVSGWLFMGQMTGMYDLHTAARVRPCLTAIWAAALLVTMVFATFFFSKPYFIGRERLVSIAFGAPILLSIWRLVYIRFLGSEHLLRRILILGGGGSGRALLRAINGNSGHGVAVAGIIDDDPSLRGATIEQAPVLGDSSRIISAVTSLGIEEVVLAISQPTNEALFEGLAECYERGIAVSLMPHMYEDVARQVPVEHVGRHWLGAVPLGRSGGGVYHVLKRLLDIVCACLGLVAAAPLMLLIALMIRATSRGPVLFRQARVGLRGQVFNIVKFRTMRFNVEPDEEPVTPPVTWVGRWLRLMHLDELPQLLLVLTGKMSLVGPRPFMLEEHERGAKAIRLYAARYSVRPGVTGWAQIQCKHPSSGADDVTKLRYDLYYVKHGSLMLDATILARTLVYVLGLGGR